jgi:TonB family protein
MTMMLGAVVVLAALLPARIEEPRLAVPEQLMRWRVEKRVEPRYPDVARRLGIAGSVRFAAVIGRDGSVKTLHLISGHPFLVPAALKAAKQWVFRPLLHRGEPIEVVTSITIEFRLPAAPARTPLIRAAARASSRTAAA